MACVMAIPAAAEWTPPEKPDPQAILQEAGDDKRAKRYEDALAKQVWFHEHALEHRSSLTGVRLSFALSYWVELGDAYPPALEKLESIRDEARTQFLDSKLRHASQLFSDFAAMNRVLEEESLTTDLFLALAKEASPKAELVFEVALPALLKSKEYKLCGQYLEPEKTFKQSLGIFHFHEKMAQDPKYANHNPNEFGHKKFTSDMAILTALLVINDRKPEALAIVEKAKKEWSNDAFHTALAKALTGEVPQPWP